MNIAIHIERLVLEGLPVTSYEAPLVQAAVEAELTRLLSQGGVAPSLRRGADLHYLRADSVNFDHDARPIAMGSQIASVVHKSIGNVGAPTHPDKAIWQSSGALR
jgi:hypothetical protein